jgi:hypothetical protein
VVLSSSVEYPSALNCSYSTPWTAATHQGNYEFSTADRWGAPRGRYVESRSGVRRSQCDGWPSQGAARRTGLLRASGRPALGGTTSGPCRMWPGKQGWSPSSRDSGSTMSWKCQAERSWCSLVAVLRRLRRIQLLGPSGFVLLCPLRNVQTARMPTAFKALKAVGDGATGRATTAAVTTAPFPDRCSSGCPHALPPDRSQGLRTGMSQSDKTPYTSASQATCRGKTYMKRHCRRGHTDARIGPQAPRNR